MGLFFVFPYMIWCFVGQTKYSDLGWGSVYCILQVGKKIRFCAIRSLIFNGSCSNFEHFSLIIGQIFEDFIQKYKFLSIYLSFKIVGFDKHAKYREKAQMLYDYDS